MPDLTINRLVATNVERALRWHKTGLDGWSPSDWAVAMAGEAGEVCNAVKKMNRLRDGFASVNEPSRTISDMAQAKAKIGEELADTVHYCTLLAARLGIDLEKELIDKFNSVSVAHGFPERL